MRVCLISTFLFHKLLILFTKKRKYNDKLLRYNKKPAFVNILVKIQNKHMFRKKSLHVFSSSYAKLFQLALNFQMKKDFVELDSAVLIQNPSVLQKAIVFFRFWHL